MNYCYVTWSAELSARGYVIGYGPVHLGKTELDK